MASTKVLQFFLRGIQMYQMVSYPISFKKLRTNKNVNLMMVLQEKLEDYQSCWNVIWAP